MPYTLKKVELSDEAVGDIKFVKPGSPLAVTAIAARVDANLKCFQKLLDACLAQSQTASAQPTLISKQAGQSVCQDVKVNPNGWRCKNSCSGWCKVLNVSYDYKEVKVDSESDLFDTKEQAAADVNEKCEGAAINQCTSMDGLAGDWVTSVNQVPSRYQGVPAQDPVFRLFEPVCEQPYQGQEEGTCQLSKP